MQMPAPRVTKAQVEAVLSYEPETGLFRHLVTRGRAKAGEVAGHVNERGYRQLRVEGRVYYGHTLAWLIMTGEWVPEGKEVDHRHGVSEGDRWSNLRLANRSQQTLNGKMRQDNTSGVRGVRYDAKRGNWQAELVAGGVRVLFQRFPTKDEAVAARQAAVEKHCPGFVRA